MCIRLFLLCLFPPCHNSICTRLCHSCSLEQRAMCAGTIAFARTADGRECRSSGWGPAFLDPGSGYDIGEQHSVRKVM